MVRVRGSRAPGPRRRGTLTGVALNVAWAREPKTRASAVWHKCSRSMLSRAQKCKRPKRRPAVMGEGDVVSPQSGASPGP